MQLLISKYVSISKHGAICFLIGAYLYLDRKSGKWGQNNEKL